MKGTCHEPLYVYEPCFMCIVQAAQAMQRYSDWAPIKFEEPNQNSDAAPVTTRTNQGLVTSVPDGGLGQQNQQGVGLTEAPGGNQGLQRPVPDPTTFVYDPASGTTYALESKP